MKSLHGLGTFFVVLSQWGFCRCLPLAMEPGTVQAHFCCHGWGSEGCWHLVCGLQGSFHVQDGALRRTVGLKNVNNNPILWMGKKPEFQWCEVINRNTHDSSQ